MNQYKFPEPPSYYTEFKDSENALAPPDLEQISALGPEFMLFRMEYPFKHEEKIRSNIDPAIKKVNDNNEVMDYKYELKKLNHSLLKKILEFYEFINTKDDDYAKKIDEIQYIALNFMHVYNIYKDRIKAKQDMVDLRLTQIESYTDHKAEFQRFLNEKMDTLGQMMTKMNKIHQEDLYNSL